MSLVMMGFGVTGRAVTAACRDRDIDVLVADDALDADSATSTGLRRDIVEIGAKVLPSEKLADAVREACSVVVTPGLPDAHRVFVLADEAGVDVIDEFDLAAGWDDRPCVAITGTNGKTTVTMMVTEMLVNSGIAARDAGNTEVPLVAAINDLSVEVFVVEASSFRLGHTKKFAPTVATWLNFAPDHLDIHSDLEAYERAKAAIWDRSGVDTTVVANTGDEVVMAHVPAGAHTVTFGPGGDFELRGETLIANGEQLCAVSSMPRALPHDIDNALAAAATAISAGASHAAVAAVIQSPPVLAHRVEFVAEIGDVRFYDDSKATVPQATVAAVGGFDSVVLIAGGRNKGLDLTPLSEVADRLRAVIAIGEAADEIDQVFGQSDVAVHRSESMTEAVAHSAQLAQRGDAVLLSPACASFDMYDNYAQRGDEFARAVMSRAAADELGGQNT
jgi:UDP-N-acetylmuramoylalanine--D-glutamate ligase